MNKSKFLKKSLAMLLALMLVLAMIPLSASAAPSKDFKVSSPDGTVTETADGWNADLKYTTNPVVVFEPAANETVDYVNGDGETVDVTNNTVALPVDDDGQPTPLTIKITNNGVTTEHVIRWSMAAATGAEGVSVASAKIGDATNGYITGTVEGQNINFVIPYGTSWDYNNIDVGFTGIDGTPTENLSGLVIGTHMKKAVPGTIVVKPQNDSKELTYTITVKEETLLTDITLGDYEGEIEIGETAGTTSYLNPGAYDEGYETGRLVFTIPAGLDGDDLVKLATQFTVSASYKEVTYENSPISNGDEVDYSDAYNAVKALKFTNAYGGSRTYLITFVNDPSNTAITAATATIGTKTYDGTVDGENIEIIVPADASLSSVSVSLTGPAAVTGGTPTVAYVTTPSSTTSFSNAGVATFTVSNYTAPIRLVVTAADGDSNAYYTLTITKAEAPQKNPQVTSAKVVLWPGTDNEYTATGNIDQSEDGKITFTVPYRTNDAAVKGAEYAFAKTSQTSWDSTNNPDASSTWTVKDGGKLGVASNDTDDAKVYTIVFDRMDPRDWQVHL